MKTRLYEREWEYTADQMTHAGAVVNLKDGLGWVTPHGTLLNTNDPRGVRQFECLFRATYHGEAEQVEWLASQGLEHVRGAEGRGVMIGHPDPIDPAAPLMFRASGLSLKDALLDLAGRL